ncbi:DUF2474 family protein [Neoasaia chiangmaiensis]|nr:DUF2474 family protein [Neoasaia chiangmaiensis]
MPAPRPSTTNSRVQRIAWFVGLWAAGVLVTGLAAEGLKLVIFRQW